jgi:hypothetical protein
MPQQPKSQIPPLPGPDGHDAYPFSLVVGKNSTPYAHWFDAVLARGTIGAATPYAKVRIEGVHPSHDMVPWVNDIRECSVCNGLEETDAAIVPCGFEFDALGQVALFEAAKEARARAEQGDLS